MYDACDVIKASYCSADVATHVLRGYGEGNMGAGIRKLAGEMLTIGGQESYALGYEAGVASATSISFKKGATTATIICVCATAAVGIGMLCTKKVIDYKRAKKLKAKPVIEEEVSEKI